MKPWYVLGAGAIGGLWALRLHHAGFPVTLLSRPDATGPVPLRMLSLQDGPRHWQAGFAETRSSELPPQSIERLLVTTKAQDTLGALQTLLPALSDNARVVLLQNGMGVREELLGIDPLLTIFSAITTDGVYRRSRDDLVLAGQGDTFLGTLDDTQRFAGQSLARELLEAGLPLQYANDIEARLWQKLAINCAINPLTVRYNCRNGELLPNAEALELMRAVCTELASVMQARGLAQSSAALFTTATAVAGRTAANTSSMLADVQAGRATEIAYMNGFVCREGLLLGVECPTNKILFEYVSSLHR